MAELEFDPKDPTYDYIEKQEDLGRVIEASEGRKVIAVDVEGDSLDPHNANLVLVQIGLPEKAFVIDVRKVDISPLKKLLENPKILKILQNGKFDYAMLKVNRGIVLENIFDTMLAERILTTGIGRENSLEAMAGKYLDIALEKDIRKTFNSRAAVSKKQLEYAAMDVLVLFPIFKEQFARLRQEDLLKIAQLEFRVLPVVAEMEIRGSFIDVSRWRENIGQLKESHIRIAGEMQSELRPLYRSAQTDLFGNQADVVNLNSPIQIMDAFRKVGVDLPSTGEAILRQTSHPMARMLLEYRSYEKLISAFGENLLSKINPKTGRIHPDYMQIGADTGRFACSNPNLQQIPKESSFRGCFVAPKGFKLVVADYSQIELRIMAELSQDPVFMKAFREKQDLHTLTASQMYGVPSEAVDKKMRFNAKSINFGLMYGRGAGSLAIQLGISVDEAKNLLNKYFGTYRKVKNWLDAVGREAVRLGFSQTLGGRKRWYQLPDKSDPAYERLIANFERQGKNTPIQGSSADMTKYALVYIYDKIKKEKYEAYPIHTVHDEIVVEVREEEAGLVRSLVEDEMVRAGGELLKTVPVEVDAKISDVWEH